MEINKKTLRSVFVVAAASIFLYWLLNKGAQVKTVWGVISGILSPFVLGATLAFILNVPMRAIEGLLQDIKSAKLRRTVALLLTLVAVILILTIVFLLLIPQLSETLNSLIPMLTNFFQKVGESFNKFLQDNPQLMEWIAENTELENFDWAGLVERVVSMVGNSVTTILSKAYLAVGSVITGLMNLVIGIVFALYCLNQKETLARQGRKLLYAFLPEHVSDKIVRMMRLSNSTFSNFLSGQCLEVCILGTMFAISMAIFGMPYIPLVSVLVAVTAFIPIVGAWVGCAVGAFLIFVANPMQAVWFIIMFVVLQQIENNMIYPRVVGVSIGLPGMWVLLAVAVGGELFGVAGMFLMIPVASVMYTLLREYTGNRLRTRDIRPDKLEPQPPELKSQFRERIRSKAEKRKCAKAEKQNEK